MAIELIEKMRNQLLCVTGFFPWPLYSPSTGLACAGSNFACGRVPPRIFSAGDPFPLRLAWVGFATALNNDSHLKKSKPTGPNTTESNPTESNPTGC
jgi:hypothetical protein